ncbi:MAG TPA: hypothetical protein VHK90_08890, partial [Thermoanaerobaculia bacterium]|nr:hypothetical protein [Thermoanaerobaculia bacterium]
MLVAEPFSAGASGHAEPADVAVTFELLPQSQAGSRPSGTLIVRPSGGDGGERKLPITSGSPSFSATPGSRLRVELVSRDWWFDPADVTVPPSGGAIPLRVWP